MHLQPAISFTITDELRRVLTKQGIQPGDYKPAYGGESVGLDLYWAAPPDPDGSLSFGEFPLAGRKIPTGVKVALPMNYMGLVLQRGSILKTKESHRAGVIDPGYTGEIWVGTHKLAQLTEWEYIRRGMKLPYQLVVIPVVTNFTYVDPALYEEIAKDSKRGEACLGSTN